MAVVERIDRKTFTEGGISATVTRADVPIITLSGLVQTPSIGLLDTAVRVFTAASKFAKSIAPK